MSGLKTKGTTLIIFIILVIANSTYAANSLWMETSANEPGEEMIPKLYLYLYFGKFPRPRKALNKARAWLETPDGGIEELSLVKGERNLHSTLRAKYGGLYTALASYEERTEGQGYWSQKPGLIKHYARIQFFRPGPEGKRKRSEGSPAKIPLEIIPITSLGRHQHLHEGDKFAVQVVYEGEPLADAPLLVTTQEGWQREFTTDNQGKVVITFIRDRDLQPGNMRVVEKYLFRAEHQPARTETYQEKTSPNICYIATYMVDIYPPPWEWRSKSLGYLTVMVTIIVVIGVVAARRRGRP